MLADAKRGFIVQLMRTLQEEILGNVPRMPEEWDGIELRQYIADKAAASVMGDDMKNKRSSRRRDYENTILTENL